VLPPELTVVRSSWTSLQKCPLICRRNCCFLQTGQILPVGGTEERTVDVRLIAATNRPPRSAIDDGLLREDLFYRLYVIPIELPPLRNRGDDVLTIAEHYLTLYSRCEGRSFKEISADAKEQIRNHPWPGNVRQLQNAIRRAVVMNDSDVLTADMLLQDSVLSGGSSLTTTATSQPEDRMPASMLRVSPQNPVVPFRLRLPRQDDRPSQLAPSIQSIRPLWLVEKEAIEAAVTACGGNVVKAAAFLEIAPSTIYRKLQTWEKQS